jgi:hypothetical protein
LGLEACPFIPFMVCLTKKKRDMADMLGSATVEAFQLAIPLVQAIPLVGGAVAACLQTTLYIIQVKDVRLSPSIFQLSVLTRLTYI